jgi:hypothetical protein
MRTSRHTAAIHSLCTSTSPLRMGTTAVPVVVNQASHLPRTPNDVADLGGSKEGNDHLRYELNHLKIKRKVKESFAQISDSGGDTQNEYAGLIPAP